MLPEWVDWGFVEATWRIGVIMGVLIGFLLGMVVRYLMHSLQDHHRKGYTVNDVL